MKKLIAIAIMAGFTSAAYAKVEIKGNNTQAVKVKNGAILNMSSGMVSKAKLSAASVEGNVKIDGNNTQTLDVNNGALLNMAMPGSEAELSVGTVTGK
ncbi:hypothetical protein [Chromobacterium haemolyticum]|uniref:hypothetical protein n=1 Tax=Chromobacterium haemolyticum TaxID=394935 RepID=UPI00131681D6|nr:hypothetical protein [Chromobacterium haemolyticum]BBH12250.1 hypothetical protein CH06BL_14980 [Chromobacterium haemolyticum]